MTLTSTQDMNKEPKDNPSTKHETPKTARDPIEIDVHGLKAKFFLNRPLQDIIPEKYLAKAEKTRRTDVVQRTPWVFKRKERNAYRVDLNRWSELDIRYRGVFWTMKKIRGFENTGLYESRSGYENSSTNARNTEGNAKTQSHVVYALLTELVDGLRMKRQVGNGSERWIELRPRLFNCCMEYWTGYRAKFKDGPITAGFLSLHFSPGVRADHTVIPISTTEHDTCLEDALEGKFKLLLGQFLQNIFRLKPPGDRLLDQEVFLIGLHGSHLHILRGIFPGHKTSHLWSGRYTPSTSSDFLNRMEEMVNHSSDDDDAKTFNILASAEYNLWLESDFHEAVKALVGLIMYLMSGEAHCGPLEAAFNNLPPETNRKNRQRHCDSHEENYSRADENGNHEDQRMDTVAFEQEAEERLALTRVEANDQKKENKREIKRRKREEKIIWKRQMGHGSAGHRIASFGGFRKAWWKMVWHGRD